MQPRTEKYLCDVQLACEDIQRFIAGRSFEEYQRSDMLRAAVERKFEIIGEALKQMFQYDPEQEAYITHAPRIIAFRNQLIHGYSRVSDEVVWSIIHDYLPLLKDEAAQLIG